MGGGGGGGGWGGFPLRSTGALLSNLSGERDVLSQEALKYGC